MVVRDLGELLIHLDPHKPHKLVFGLVLQSRLFRCSHQVLALEGLAAGMLEVLGVQVEGSTHGGTLDGICLEGSL